MKKVADKAYLPAMRELLDYYTAIRDGEKPERFEECPLCDVVYHNEIYDIECSSCPWVIYTKNFCMGSKQVMPLGEINNKHLPHIGNMRNNPTKRWLSTRIRQLTSWIERTEA